MEIAPLNKEFWFHRMAQKPLSRVSILFDLGDKKQ